MKKLSKLLFIAATAVLLLSISAFPAFSVVDDNNGNSHNYVSMASKTVSNPENYFPSGYGTVSGGKKAICANGGIVAYMVPQYNRNAISVDNTREATMAAATGFYFDGVVTCNDRTKHSETKRSVSSYTGWVWCNNHETTYCG